MATGTRNKRCFGPETSPPSLPVEVVTEILSWLPIKSLLVSKCVCKEWKSIIEEQTFIDTQKNRSGNILLYGEHEVMDVSWERFRVIRAYEGLVLEAGNHFTYRVKNPATRQVLTLPYPSMQRGQLFFKYVYGSMVYKLIHMHATERGSRDLCCNVLTVACDLTWRRLITPTLNNFYGDGARICFGEDSDLVYILKIGRTALAESKVVLFDLVTECFSCLPLPRRFFRDWNNVHPLMWEGKLSLTSVVEDKLIIWVLDSYKLNQWADRKIVIPLTFVQFAAVDKVYASRLSGNILYINVNGHVCISYDMEEKKVITIWPLRPSPYLRFELRPSLVQLKGMKPEERLF